MIEDTVSLGSCSCVFFVWFSVKCSQRGTCQYREGSRWNFDNSRWTVPPPIIFNNLNVVLIIKWGDYLDPAQFVVQARPGCVWVRKYEVDQLVQSASPVSWPQPARKQKILVDFPLQPPPTSAHTLQRSFMLFLMFFCLTWRDKYGVERGELL